MRVVLPAGGLGLVPERVRVGVGRARQGQFHQRGLVGALGEIIVLQARVRDGNQIHFDADGRPVRLDGLRHLGVDRVVGVDQAKSQRLAVFNANRSPVRGKRVAQFLQEGDGHVRIIGQALHTVVMRPRAGQDRPVQRDGLSIQKSINQTLTVESQHECAAEFGLLQKCDFGIVQVEQHEAHLRKPAGVNG